MNKQTTFLNLLLTAGLLSFIATMFGYFHSARQERQQQQSQFEQDIKLRKVDFQYALIKDALNKESVKELDASIRLYKSLGWLDSNVVVDSIHYFLGYHEGKLQGRASASIKGAIEEFVTRAGRVPQNIEELKAAINITASLGILDNNIHYRATAPKNFELRFPGGDGLLFTNDDKLIRYEDLNI